VPQGAGHPIGRLPRDLRRDMARGVHRERDLAVPEGLYHIAGRRAHPLYSRTSLIFWRNHR
jgi:hypothetical protein